MVNNITTVATFRGRRQQKKLSATTEDKTRQDDDVTVAEIEVGIKALDRHIGSLKAKPSFIVRLYDD
jgi:hypothetical protein